MFSRNIVAWRRYGAVCVVLTAVFAAGCLDRGVRDTGTGEEPGYLVRIETGDGEHYQFGSPSLYVNEKGDTVIPPDKYYFGYNDTIRTYGLVVTHDGDLIAIDPSDSMLYRVFWFDNGPDYIEEGLFRILDDQGNMGYASGEDGRVVIEPRFAFAEPFAGDSARVCDDGIMVPIGEYSYWESDGWYYIDKQGNPLP